MGSVCALKVLERVCGDRRLKALVLEGSFTSALDVFLGIGFLLRPFRAYLETLPAYPFEAPAEARACVFPRRASRKLRSCLGARRGSIVDETLVFSPTRVEKASSTKLWSSPRRASRKPPQAAACARNVFQYHGTRDGTIGIDIGRRLAARIKGHNRKAIFVTVEGKHHGNAFRSEALQAELAPFLRRAFPA